MLRYLFIVLTLMSLSACSNDEPENHTEEKDHAEHSEANDHAENEGEGGHEEEAGTIHLKPAQLKMAGIVVTPLQFSIAAQSIKAPAEVKLNAYKTIKVTPRINAQILKRHAKLGDEVILGQALVTLSSVEMAEAQGQLLLADKEWKRVKKLGRKVVSARRYITAKIDYEKSYASRWFFPVSCTTGRSYFT